MAGLHRQHRRGGVQAHIASLQGCQGLLPVEGPRLGQGGGPLLDQGHRGGASQQIGQLAGQFHPTGARTDDGNALLVASSLPQSFDQLIQAFHIGQGAEEQAMLPGPGHPEGFIATTGGQHQLAELDAAAAGHVHLMAVGVYRRNPIPQPGHATAGEQGVVAGANFPAAQLAAEQLVEQGQKQEALARFDQQDRRVVTLAGQGQSRVETSEATTGDYHRF